MNSRGSWELQVDPSVLKSLKKIPPAETRRILEVIRLLPANPYFGDIQKMRGEADVWRRRIGAYRLFYKIYSKELVILVFRIERRTSKTY